MSLKRKMVGVCLVASLIAPALPMQAAESNDSWLGWAERVWQELQSLLPEPTEPSTTIPECKPPGQPSVSPCVEPSG